MDSLVIIARIKSEFPSKFGIPRQSGVVTGLRSTIVFEPEFRNPDSLRGLEGFSHLWLIWGFSESPAARGGKYSPTVRPPRLGGNTRMGVFATRSPNRPNPLGLSAVKLDRVEPETPNGPVIHILGGDLMDGTPVYDIKPYLPFADCIECANGGFASEAPTAELEVELACEASGLSLEKIDVLKEVLSQDPRPRYHSDPERVYGMQFSGYEIKFMVNENKLRVISISQEA